MTSEKPDKDDEESMPTEVAKSNQRISVHQDFVDLLKVSEIDGVAAKMGSLDENNNVVELSKFEIGAEGLTRQGLLAKSKNVAKVLSTVYYGREARSRKKRARPETPHNIGSKTAKLESSNMGTTSSSTSGEPGVAKSPSSGAETTQGGKVKKEDGQPSPVPSKLAAREMAEDSESDDDDDAREEDSEDVILRMCSIATLRKLEAADTPKTAAALSSEVALDFVHNLGLVGAKMRYFSERVATRVCDTLDVLVAIGFATKENNRYEYRPMSQNPTRDLAMMQQERLALVSTIRAKSRRLEELLMQSIALRNLAERNTVLSSSVPDDQKIPLPFIVVSTNKDTVIECEMAENRSDILFNFNQPFQIHDDASVLRRLNLHRINREALSKLLPERLAKFVPEEALLD
mmetsp:Transcript_11310/g.19973  ORF Transcript_11310/g.19973 Transcript_11310/m.19973 type:complete len:404 (-) Transcript_11310:126-1337(-)